MEVEEKELDQQFLMNKHKFDQVSSEIDDLLQIETTNPDHYEEVDLNSEPEQFNEDFSTNLQIEVIRPAKVPNFANLLN